MWILVFLIYGFITDSVIMLHQTSWFGESLYQTAIFLHNFYSLFDAGFLLVFMAMLTDSKKERKYLFILAGAMLPFWLISYFWIKNAFAGGGTLSAIFDSSYEIILALVAAYMLVQSTRPDRSTESWKLWVLIGIFFYNFCSFFIQAFIDASVIGHIWYINALINILTMIIYSMGFLFALRKRSANGSE